MFVPFSILVALTVVKAIAQNFQQSGNWWSSPHLVFLLKGEDIRSNKSLSVKVLWGQA